MSGGTNVLRGLMMFGIGLPLSVYLGYTLVNPSSVMDFWFILGVIGLFLVPGFLKWHQPIMFLSWNATMGLYFMKGNMPVWAVTSAMVVALLIIQAGIHKNPPLVYSKTLNAPILFFTVVILATIFARGGLGMQMMGSDQAGGSKYIRVFGAILGLFALSLLPVPKPERHRYIAFFFLSGLTGCIGPIAQYIGGPFRYLVYLFDLSGGVEIDTSALGGSAFRIKGFSTAGMAICLWLLATYGLRGFLKNTTLFRWAAFLIGITLITISGFRSWIILMVGVGMVMFWLEGLHKQKIMLVCVIGIILGYIGLFISAPHLPFPTQRAISFIPGLPVLEGARWDASTTIEWRWGLWGDFISDIPRYFWVGKGLGTPASELEWALNASKFHRDAWYYSYLTGEHHNGILSVLLTFGIWGLLAYVWFTAVSIWLLVRNMKSSEPEFIHVNRLLLAYFLTYTLLFITYAGTLYWQFRDLTGIVGLSLALNGGVLRQSVPSRDVEYKVG